MNQQKQNSRQNKFSKIVVRMAKKKILNIRLGQFRKAFTGLMQILVSCWSKYAKAMINNDDS